MPRSICIIPVGAGEVWQAELLQFDDDASAAEDR